MTGERPEHHKQSQISTNICPHQPRADTPQVPFQNLSQNSGSHLSQLSAPLFTEDRYSTSTDNEKDNCDAEVSIITRWQTPLQVTTIVMSPKRPVSTPSMVDYSTQGDPNQIAPQGNHEYSQNNSTIADPVSTAYNEDMIPDLTTQKPPPRTVPYQPPSFNLDRPTRCLMKEERIEVHH